MVAVAALPGRIRDLRPIAVDAMLAAAVVVVGIFDIAIWFPSRDVPPGFHVGFGSYVLVTLACGSLVLRRRKPWVGYGIWLLAEWGGLLLRSVAMYRYGATIAEVVWVFSLGEQSALLVSACALVLESALNIVVGIVLPHTHVDLFYAAYDCGFLVLAWLAGLIAQRRRRFADALREQTRQLSEEQRALTTQAVTLERARIAGELRELIARGLEAMKTGAATARTELGGDPAQAARAIAAIEGSGRQTLVEMGRILTLMAASDEALLGVRTPHRDGVQ